MRIRETANAALFGLGLVVWGSGVWYDATVRRNFPVTVAPVAPGSAVTWWVAGAREVLVMADKGNGAAMVCIEADACVSVATLRRTLADRARRGR